MMQEKNSVYACFALWRWRSFSDVISEGTLVDAEYTEVWKESREESRG